MGNDIKVGFLTPDNQKIEMNYDEVSFFCEQLCLSPENYQRFQKFQQNYTYFSPFFDFLMFELNYVFVNPLLKENTFLKCVHHFLYQVKAQDLQEITYQSIEDYAIRIYNGGNLPYMVACSDHSLHIEKVQDVHLGYCMIHPNGYRMIAYDLEKENHELTATTIFHQLLLHSKYLYHYYDANQYLLILLIRQFGFLSVNSDQYMIGFEKMLSPVTKKIKEDYEKQGFVFYDWEEEEKDGLKEPFDYIVRR